MILPTTRAVCTAVALLAGALAGCGNNPPVPDWKMNAHGSLERATAAYLAGKDAAEQNEFTRARQEIGSTGKLSLAIQAELSRCASRAAALVFEECPGFDRLQADATPADRAYAAWLAGRITASGAALLPEQHRAAASAAAAGNEAAAGAAVAAIKDPLSRLVAAGAVLRAGRASPEVLTVAVDTASAQGWRRPLIAWLTAQALRAEQAGDTEAAARLRRRIALASE